MSAPAPPALGRIRLVLATAAVALAACVPSAGLEAAGPVASRAIEQATGLQADTVCDEGRLTARAQVRLACRAHLPEVTATQACDELTANAARLPELLDREDAPPEIEQLRGASVTRDAAGCELRTPSGLAARVGSDPDGGTRIDADAEVSIARVVELLREGR